MNGVSNPKPEVREDCIEIMNEVIKRFNGVLMLNPGLVKNEVLMKTLLSEFNLCLIFG